ncbi:hypothetical protein DQ04_01141150 [Trypanosoma grayi]|uniref:hypothetical protein n=1 Tax=Trypanosoma grayi TaxID=71804 RepID=UPI0004F41A65|nr:hypothetical protein DQ04_01141150 [Trypanosoma grayi]KEG13229.1 hypothetical protein DQ04_01141150 [Trypanosoma grayi]
MRSTSASATSFFARTASRSLVPSASSFLRFRSSSSAFAFSFARPSTSFFMFPMRSSISIKSRRGSASFSSSDCMRSWHITMSVFCRWLSLVTNAMAEFLASSTASRSARSLRSRSSASRRLTCAVSEHLVASEMRSAKVLVPIKSSRYSSRPSSPSRSAFGFMRAICSTSPCRIRNRLCSRSTPSATSVSTTSRCVDLAPPMKYCDEPLLCTSRLMDSTLPGTSCRWSGLRCSSPDSRSRTKLTVTDAYVKSGWAAEL